MAHNDGDRSVHEHIGQLVQEEHRLYGKTTLTDADTQRLKKVQVELDQYWDLLRQRRALREFRENPDQARVRPADVVEKYEQ
ncbi:MAG TPA: DUF2630 family protein [Candidatus Polarisedimenticolia bacterium]